MPDWQLQWRNVNWLWVSLVVVVLDQLTKWQIEQHLSLYERIEILPFFNLTLAHNPGAAFSMFADAGGWQRWFFTFVAIITITVMLVWLLRLKGERILAAGLALIVGGAVGNLVDRVLHGHVVDFLDFHWAAWHFPAFNIADAAITLGAICLIADMFLEGARHRARATQGDRS